MCPIMSFNTALLADSHVCDVTSSDYANKGVSSIMQSEENSRENELPPHKAQDNYLPYDLERVMRAYTLFIMFLQLQHSLSNSCINALLQATHAFLDQIASPLKDERLTTLAATFPRTLYRLKSWLHISEAAFHEYALCPTCGWTY